MKIVAISGMIGAGKTTLCDGLARVAGWSIVREEVSQNPFLPLFYDNMERWALASQLTFMVNKTRAFEQILASSSEVTLVDRTIQEDFFVFSSVLRKYEILSAAEFALVETIYEQLTPLWRAYDLMVYLQDTDENCFQRLLSRGNSYESKIELGYVRGVSMEYKKWEKRFLRAPYYELNPSTWDFRKDDILKKILNSIQKMI